MNQTSVLEIPRSSNEWTTAKDLRALIKANLGYNAKQVSVSTGHSNQYLTITVRDANVSLEKVNAFAKTFNTWEMDNTDYVTGQSINVNTTKEVDEIHLTPFIEEIKNVVPKCEMNHGIGLSNGCTLWLVDQGFYVSRDNNRLPYVYAFDVKQGSEWEIKRLALYMARL